MKKKYFLAILISATAAFTGCKESIINETIINVPIIEAKLAVSKLTATSAEYGSTITSDFGETVTDRGICWSLNINPTLKDSLAKGGKGIGEFSCKMKNLLPNSSYYVRSYAQNNKGIVYGGTVSFTTYKTPTITSSTKGITFYDASVKCSIATSFELNVLSKGVCWSTSQNPTIELQSITNNGIGIDSFACIIPKLNPTTTYYYRPYFTTTDGTIYGNNESFTTYDTPKISSSTAQSISSSQALINSTITSTFEFSVLSKGVCWSTIQNPTISLQTKTNDGVGTDSFSSTITSLTPSSTYYYRAYYTTTNGTIYGQQNSFTTLSGPASSGTVSDIDGNVYNYITIGTQTWMINNLKTTKYKNGDVIGTSTYINQSLNGGTSYKYQWPADGNAANLAIHGRLYTWYAATDSRGIAPEGWHVATNAEWTALENYLIANGYNYDKSTTGNKISKSISSKSLWSASTVTGSVGNNLSLNNTAGLNIYPSGYRGYDGTFYLFGDGCDIWTATESNIDEAYMKAYGYNAYSTNTNSLNKNYGFSIRCVRD